MESITIKSKNKKDLKIIADLARHLKAEVQSNETAYDPEFVEKIKRGEAAAERGQGMKVNVDELWT